ncbi:hypothetical protein [Luteolibacter sp. LG18]|uniref:hypothetical protein n=1 Tax=Luteolibacter sp. LG18 TaxID=2819286 RepID=UPI0030C67EB0
MADRHSVAAAAARRRLASRWIDADPQGAMAFARGLVAGEERTALMRDLLRGWAVKAPDDALAWSAGLEDSGERRSTRSVVCYAVAERDPRVAIERAVAHHADEAGGDSLLENLAMQWAAREPEAVVEWGRDQPPGLWRDRILARASFVVAKSDPMAAAGLVAGLEPGPLQGEAAMAVLHQWGLRDPAAAGRWADGFTDAGLRARARDELENLSRHLAAPVGE